MNVLHKSTFKSVHETDTEYALRSMYKLLEDSENIYKAYLVDRSDEDDMVSWVKGRISGIKSCIETLENCKD